MNEVSKREGRTILFVSHNLGAVKQLCNSSILLDRGKLVVHEKTSNVIKSYMEQFTNTSPIFEGPVNSEKKIWFRKIYPSDSDKRLKDQFFHDEEIYFNFELSFNIFRSKHDYSIFYGNG